MNENEFVGVYYKILPYSEKIRCSDILNIERKLFLDFLNDLLPYKNIDFLEFFNKMKIDGQFIFVIAGSYKKQFLYCDCCECYYLQIELDEEKTRANIDTCLKMINLN